MQQTVRLSQITIAPDRQRKDLKDLSPLANSIRQVGLLNPVIVDEDMVLVAGERRLTACRDILGWDMIEVRMLSDLSPVEKELVELDENIKRAELTWQEETLAFARYSTLRLQAEGVTQEQVAGELGVSRAYLTQRLAVAAELQAGTEDVVNAERFSVARGIVERKQQRQKAADDARINEILNGQSPADGPATVVQKPRIQVSTDVRPRATASTIVPAADGTDILEALAADALAELSDDNTSAVTPMTVEVPFLNTAFEDFAASAPRIKFNFLHCDFPYGINAGEHDQGAGNSFGGYEDGADVYWQLLEVLDRFTRESVSESAHMMFWFSMNYYTETKERLEAMGWKVNPHPLIWYKSDNTGILPDHKRGPRQIYETCFLCTRGDRFIVRAVGNAIGAPVSKTIHMSEKSTDMLKHFMRMFVDETTLMIDPTMGSGSAVKVAESMGANYVLGLEKSTEFFDRAVQSYVDEFNAG